jgi:hypothetical protein
LISPRQFCYGAATCLLVPVVGLRRLGLRQVRVPGTAADRHRVIAAVLVALTTLTFFFDVGDFAARVDITIPPDNASTAQRGEA